MINMELKISATTNNTSWSKISLFGVFFHQASWNRDQYKAFSSYINRKVSAILILCPTLLAQISSSPCSKAALPFWMRKYPKASGWDVSFAN